MKPLAFTARCQSVDIKTQYEKYGVRCFDLRIRFKKDGTLAIAHGFIEYDYNLTRLNEDLRWLMTKEDCMVRILHEVRNKRQYSENSRDQFWLFCEAKSKLYLNIRWWCGRNLYNWEKDYDFGEDPKCDEKYASVCPPKIVDDWWPWLYARLHNRKNLKEGSEGILLIDYVNIK